MKNLITPILQISLYLIFSLNARSEYPLYTSEHLMDWNRGVSGSTYQEWTFDSIPVLIDPAYNDYGQLYEAYLYPDRYINFYGLPLLRIYGGDCFNLDGFGGLEFSNGSWWAGMSDVNYNFSSTTIISSLS